MKMIPLFKCSDMGKAIAFYKERGLDLSGKENSPVHQGPINQTRGRREFYITDAEGNTLRFSKPIW